MAHVVKFSGIFFTKEYGESELHSLNTLKGLAMFIILSKSVSNKINIETKS